MIDVADSNKKYYYHFDGLGSVIALSDSTGSIVERYSYDVFGDPNRTSDVNNPYYFTGRRLDTETDLYYYRARYYNPEIGRFMQPDPIYYEDGLNWYSYVNNNPVNWLDPWGHSATAIVVGVGGGVTVGAASVGATAIVNFYFGVRIGRDWVNPFIDRIAARLEARRNARNGEFWNKHRKGKRESTRDDHERGSARRRRDKGREKGDARRKKYR